MHTHTHTQLQRSLVRSRSAPPLSPRTLRQGHQSFDSAPNSPRNKPQSPTSSSPLAALAKRITSTFTAAAGGSPTSQRFEVDGEAAMGGMYGGREPSVGMTDRQVCLRIFVSLLCVCVSECMCVCVLYVRLRFFDITKI